MQVEETFGAKPLTSVAPHLLHLYRECLEACMEEADLEDYVSRGIGMASGRDSKVRWNMTRNKQQKEKENMERL